jgi:hypothetical protein
MSTYGFKPNPKQLVVNKAHNLFGRDANVKVTGTRPSPLDCKRLGIPSGVYYVECFVGGRHLASAHTRNWRKAYNLLAIELEKVFEAALHRAEPV